jgi:N-sulfoglucosamine sulfohydrolase
MNAELNNSGGQSSQRPNILFAVADDASHMSAYGDGFLRTPNFDRVAKAGVLFINAFTTNPKCAPSRASILTGKQTWQLEEACNHYGIFPSKFKVYPNLLEEAGYHVGFTGKGWAPGDFRKGGFDHNPAGIRYDRVSLDPPAKFISNKDYAGNFEEFLEERPKGAPFCFWYGGHEPHRPYEDGRGLRDGKNLLSVEVPGYLPDEDIVKSDLLDYAFEIEWFDHHLGLMLERLEDLGELDNTLIVATSDNGMPFPRVKGQMYELDFHLPLAIMWPIVTRGGRVVDDLISFADFAPTFLEAAGIQPLGDMVGRSFLDILKSNASGQLDPTRTRVFMGKERHDVGREGDVGYPVRVIRTREFLYVHNFKPELWPAGNPETGFTNIDSSPTKSLVMRQHEQGYDYYYDLSMGKRPAEELFKINEDGDCLKNLAYDPSYAEIKVKLWRELRATLEAQGDPRMFGKGDIFDTYEYVGGMSHSWKAFAEGLR